MPVLARLGAQECMELNFYPECQFQEHHKVHVHMQRMTHFTDEEPETRIMEVGNMLGMSPCLPSSEFWDLTYQTFRT